jgi:hypothetical protein
MECEDCCEDFPNDKLIPWKYEPDVKLCENCYEQRMDEDNPV